MREQTHTFTGRNASGMITDLANALEVARDVVAEKDAEIARIEAELERFKAAIKNYVDDLHATRTEIQAMIGEAHA